MAANAASFALLWRHFAGDLSSFIDRSMYLRAGYEENHIRAFLSHAPAERRDVILDVGANVGTHSLAFSRHFKTVHAFEPNPDLWGSFETNMALNNLSNVSLYRLGLADRDDELTLYLIDKNDPVTQLRPDLKRAAAAELHAWFAQGRDPRSRVDRNWIAHRSIDSTGSAEQTCRRPRGSAPPFAPIVADGLNRKGGQMPPGYSSRDHRRDNVRAAA